MVGGGCMFLCDLRRGSFSLVLQVDSYGGYLWRGGDRRRTVELEGAVV